MGGAAAVQTRRRRTATGQWSRRCLREQRIGVQGEDSAPLLSSLPRSSVPLLSLRSKWQMRILHQATGDR